MGQEYSWAEVREEAVRGFGARYPDAALEQEIIDRFRERPAAVVAAIEDTVRGFQAGSVKAPWPFLRARLERAPSSDVVVQDGSERDRRVANAQQWIRNCGL